MKDGVGRIKGLLPLIYAVACLCYAASGFGQGTKTSVVKKVERKSSGKGKMFTENMTIDPLTEIENSLTGRVKTIRFNEYDFVTRKKVITKVPFRSGTYTFDGFGHLIDVMVQDAKGLLAATANYKYADRKLVGWVSHDWNPSRYGISHTISYYVNGRKMEDYIVDTSINDISRQFYQYDDKGFVVEKVFGNGGRILKEMDQIDSDGVKRLRYEGWCFSDTDAHGLHLVEINIDRYDARHNHIESMAWGADSALSKNIRASYDEAGNNVTLVNAIPAAPVDSTVMKYSISGFCTERLNYRGSKLNYKLTWKYDDHCNRLEQLYYTADGKLSERGCSWHEYEYDASGNIRKHSTYALSKGKKVLSFVSEVEVAYY